MWRQVGVKIGFGFIIRAAMSGGAADHACEAWGMSAHQIQHLVQGVAPGVRFGVIVIATAQFHDTKECVHLAQACMIDGFQRPRRRVIGD